MTTTANDFSEDYFTARDRFCAMALQQGWALTSHHRLSRGEGKLFTDLARIGADRPEKLLVLSSGLHGVEGFLGSAMQLQLLKTLDAQSLRSSNVAILLVHALNPFGFARLRRVDENNVDLNRNFLLPGAEYLGAHPGYVSLNPLLNPNQWPKTELPFPVRMLPKILKCGFQNLQQAIAEGQYDFPMGLFFGGHKPSATQRFFENELLPIIAGCEAILHLDVHSGLGPSGTDHMLYDSEFCATEQAWLSEMFGDGISFVSDVSDVSEKQHYQSRGSLSRWVRHHQPRAISLCWEFGTYPPVSVLTALRAENAAYHWGDTGSSAYKAAKRRLQEKFCPQSSNWQRIVLQTAAARLSRLADEWLMR